MINVVFIDSKGREQACQGKVGDSLMTLGKHSDVAGMIGECHGALACATCLVTLAEGWIDKVPPPTADEIEMLEACECEPNQRFGCQIVLSEALEGISVTVADNR